MKIEVFFDDVIAGQDDVITFRFSLTFKISGWTIAGNKNFWIWTILIVSGISQRTPTFQISSSKKCYKSMQNPSTKPCFRVSQLLWIRWWGQIWPIQTYNDSHFIYVSRQWDHDILPSNMVGWKQCQGILVCQIHKDFQNFQHHIRP